MTEYFKKMGKIVARGGWQDEDLFTFVNVAKNAPFLKKDDNIETFVEFDQNRLGINTNIQDLADYEKKKRGSNEGKAARGLMQQIADKGYPLAQIKYAEILINDGNYVQAQKYLEMPVKNENGYVSATEQYQAEGLLQEIPKNQAPKQQLEQIDIKDAFKNNEDFRKKKENISKIEVSAHSTNQERRLTPAEEVRRNQFKQEILKNRGNHL